MNKARQQTGVLTAEGERRERVRLLLSGVALALGWTYTEGGHNRVEWGWLAPDWFNEDNQFSLLRCQPPGFDVLIAALTEAGKREGALK